MYSGNGRRRRDSFDVKEMKSISSNNLKYRGRGKKKRKGKDSVIKKKRSRAKNLRTTSFLIRTLKPSYTVIESDVYPTSRGSSKPKPLEKTSREKSKASPLKKRLSVNECGSSATDRPIFIMSSKPQWEIKQEIHKLNQTLKSSTQLCTFEEINPETKETFGRLTANMVSLKMELNQEFNTNIENAGRRESDESDDSLVFIAPVRPLSGEETGLSELYKGRQASRLFRNDRDLDALKTAMHNSYNKRKEAREKLQKERHFDREFLPKKKSVKASKNYALNKLFFNARSNVSSLKMNVSSIKKRISRGAATLTLRSSTSLKEKEKTAIAEFDLDDPDMELTPNNIKKLHFLIAKKETEAITQRIQSNSIYGDDEQESTKEPNSRKKETEDDNTQSRAAADKFKLYMENKKKKSLYEKRAAFKSRRRKKTSTIKQRHDNVKKLEELHELKLNRSTSFNSSKGTRLHSKKRVLRRRNRNGLTNKKMNSIRKDEEELSDSEVSTDSLVDLSKAEDNISIPSLVEVRSLGSAPVPEDDDDSLVFLEDAAVVQQDIEEDDDDSLVFIGSSPVPVDVDDESEEDSLVFLDDNKGEENISDEDEENSLVFLNDNKGVENISDEDEEDSLIFLDDSKGMEKISENARSEEEDSLVELNPEQSSPQEEVDEEVESLVNLTGGRKSKDSGYSERKPFYKNLEVTSNTADILEFSLGKETRENNKRRKETDETDSTIISNFFKTGKRDKGSIESLIQLEQTPISRRLPPQQQARASKLKCASTNKSYHRSTGTIGHISYPSQDY